MPLPSEATVQAAIGKACIADKELYAYLAQTGTHWVTREAAFLAAVPADSMPAAQVAQREQRKALNFATQMLAPRLEPLWQTYARVLGLAPGDDILQRLFRYMGENTKSVLSRGFSFGAVAAAGGNVGTGTVNRLTLDRYGFVIESGFAEVKTLECTRDSNGGLKRHWEEFTVRGAPAGRDDLERIGTGEAVKVRALCAESTQAAGVQNPSFDGVAVTPFTATTDVQGWVMSDITKFAVNADYYRDTPGVATNRSLELSGNCTLKQTFAAMRFNWDPTVPLYAQIAFKRSGNDGDLKITIGGKTSTVSVAGGAGWQIARFLITKDAWMLNWNAVGADPATNGITIELANRTVGTLLIDDFVLGQYAPMDGAWIAIVGGATPFVLRDQFTFTDTSTDTGIIQTQLAKAYRTYLPHLAAANTWADPT